MNQATAKKSERHCCAELRPKPKAYINVTSGGCAVFVFAPARRKHKKKDLPILTATSKNNPVNPVNPVKRNPSQRALRLP
jgi:hypothetical protein